MTDQLSRLPLSQHLCLPGQHQAHDDESPEQLYNADCVTSQVTGQLNPVFDVESGEFEKAELFYEDLIIATVFCYQQAIRVLLNIDTESPKLICVVHEGYRVQDQGIVSAQLRLGFPYCRLNTDFRRQHLNTLVEQLLYQQKVWNRFEISPRGNWGDIIQHLETHTSIYQPMNLTHIYGYIDQEAVDTGIGTELALDELGLPA